MSRTGLSLEVGIFDAEAIDASEAGLSLEAEPFNFDAEAIDMSEAGLLPEAEPFDEGAIDASEAGLPLEAEPFFDTIDASEAADASTYTLDPGLQRDSDQDRSGLLSPSLAKITS
jgi:hypothetical protein